MSADQLTGRSLSLLSVWVAASKTFSLRLRTFLALLFFFFRVASFADGPQRNGFFSIDSISGEPLDMEKGGIHLIRYGAIEGLLRAGDVELV